MAYTETVLREIQKAGFDENDADSFLEWNINADPDQFDSEELMTRNQVDRIYEVINTSRSALKKFIELLQSCDEEGCSSWREEYDDKTKNFEALINILLDGKLTDKDRVLINESLSFCDRLPEEVLFTFFKCNGQEISAEEVDEYFESLRFDEETTEEIVDLISSSERSENAFIRLFSDEIARNHLTAQEVLDFIREGDGPNTEETIDSRKETIELDRETSNDDKDFDDLCYKLCDFGTSQESFNREVGDFIKELLEKLNCSSKEFIEFLDSDECSYESDLISVLNDLCNSRCNDWSGDSYIEEFNILFESLENEFADWRKAHNEKRIQEETQDEINKFRLSQDELEEIAYPNASINTKDKLYKPNFDQKLSEKGKLVFLTTTQMKSIIDAISTHEIFRSEVEELTKIRENFKDVLKSLGEEYVERSKTRKKKIFFSL